MNRIIWCRRTVFYSTTSHIVNGEKRENANELSLTRKRLIAIQLETVKYVPLVVCMCIAYAAGSNKTTLEVESSESKGLRHGDVCMERKT